jgi:hypothetical protein
MASLSELMQAAAVTQDQQKNPFVRALEFIPEAVGKYKENQRQRQRDQLDSYLKLMDIQDKMENLRQTKIQNTIQENLAKKAGLLPMDEIDSHAAREGAMGAVGDNPGQTVNTTAGKLGKLWDDFEPGQITYGKNGLSMSFYKKGRAPGGKPNNPDARRAKIEQMAKRMTEIELGARRSSFQEYTPEEAQSIYLKNIGAAEQFYGGKGLKAPEQDPNDPFGDLGDLKLGR